MIRNHSHVFYLAFAYSCNFISKTFLFFFVRCFACLFYEHCWSKKNNKKKKNGLLKSSHSCTCVYSYIAVLITINRGPPKRKLSWKRGFTSSRCAIYLAAWSNLDEFHLHQRDWMKSTGSTRWRNEIFLVEKLLGNLVQLSLIVKRITSRNSWNNVGICDIPLKSS